MGKQTYIENNWTKNRILKTVVLALLLVSSVTLTTYCSLILVPEGQQEKQNLIFAVFGKLTSPYSINLSEPFTVSIGTMSTTFLLSATDLANGIDLTRCVNIVRNEQTVSLPVQIHFNDSRLLVSAGIKDANNDVLVSIVDNVWKSEGPTSNLIYDRNYNAYAFELLDQDRVPALQISLGYNNTILIGFSLFAQGIPYFFGMTTGTIGGATAEDLPRMRSSTLFKYPSLEYPNEMMNDTGNPSSNLLSSANGKIQYGTALAIIGGVVSPLLGGALFSVVSAREIPIINIIIKERSRRRRRQKG